MKTIEQIIRDDIGQGGPQLPSDEYEQRIDSILGQMNFAELLTRISNAVAEIGGASGMRLVNSGPVSALRSSTKEAPPATVLYTNYRGETSERTITPIRPWFGSTEWHPEPQWLLRAYDHGKGAERDFALKDFGALPLVPPGNKEMYLAGMTEAAEIAEPVLICKCMFCEGQKVSSDAIRSRIKEISESPFEIKRDPDLVQHRVHFEGEDNSTEWRDGDGSGMYPESPLLRIEVRKLYAGQA